MWLAATIDVLVFDLINNCKVIETTGVPAGKHSNDLSFFGDHSFPIPV